MADMKKGSQASGENGMEAGKEEAMKREDMKEENRKTGDNAANADMASEETAKPESGVHKAEAGNQSDLAANKKENGKSDFEENQDGTEESGFGKSGKEARDSGSGKKVKKDKKDEKIEELTDRLQRQMAEFDNFRKRTDREKSEMFDMGARDVIEKILPVVDNFERGLAGADESDPFVQGMNKIYKQMTKILTDMGVETIEAEGAEFDPNLHNAVMHEDNPDVGENIITQELQKGYKYKDVVVRHSMVKVAN